MKTRFLLPRRGRQALWFAALVMAPGLAMAADATKVNRTVIADVVALDQPFLWNRLGTSQPGGMIFALRGDVVPSDKGSDLRPGKVMLRSGKRPRPLVLRINLGDRLVINFTNLLAPCAINGSGVTRYAGVHINGLDLLGAINSDASWVGQNPNSLAAPGESKVYEYYARAEGTYLLCNGADNDDGTSSAGFGLFGAVNVQPQWAEWYRSQVTREDLILATVVEPPGGKGPIAAPG